MGRKEGGSRQWEWRRIKATAAMIIIIVDINDESMTLDVDSEPSKDDNPLTLAFCGTGR
jgi:hypothetical protein